MIHCIVKNDTDPKTILSSILIPDEAELLQHILPAVIEDERYIRLLILDALRVPDPGHVLLVLRLVLVLVCGTVLDIVAQPIWIVLGLVTSIPSLVEFSVVSA